MYRRNEHQHLQPLIPNRPDITNRQDLPPVYALNGALYLARTDWLIENQGFVGPKTLGYVMPEERSVDLDVPLDWQWVEFLMKRN
jgi:CMP-N,N'-diacetyllegionaminic acid synthase